MPGRVNLRTPRPAPLALEQRLMFDGAAAAEVVSEVVTVDSTSPEVFAKTDTTLAVSPEGRTVSETELSQPALADTAPSLLSLMDQAEIIGPSSALAESQILNFLQQITPQQLLEIFPGSSSGAADNDALLHAQQVLDDILSGRVSLNVRLLDNDVLRGAMGAFAGSAPDGEPCIFLNRQWVENFASQNEIARVLTEEFGHALDALLHGGADSEGDEGQLFSMLAEGKTVTERSLIAMLAEFDHDTLLIDGIEVDVELAEIAVPFTDGFIARQGTSSNASTGIVTFTTLGIKSATIFKESTNGKFGGTQGNDYAVGIRLLFTDGRVLTLDGAVNWRKTDSGNTVMIGVIAAVGTNLSFAYGNQTYTIDGLSNFGLELVNVNYSAYQDGGTLSGDAATKNALDSLNTYLAEVQVNDPVGPVSVTSLTGSDTTPMISGSATLRTGETLSVMVNGVNYTTADGLQLSGSSWSLTIPAANALPVGTYSVVATITNSSGFTLVDSTSNELVITASDSTPPTINGPSGSAGDATSSKTVSENTTTVTTLSADEPVTWSLVGGEDQAKFTIDPTTGALSFVAAPNFENPTDGATSGSNTYVVQVSATDGNGNTSLQTITVTVTDVDEGVPLIQGPSGSAGDATSSKTVSENTTSVATLTANEPVTWSLVGGEDQAKFTVDPVTGALSFVTAPNFENPTDGATSGSNTYVVQVQATDGSGNTSLQTITVTVTDVDEGVPLIQGPSGSAGDATSSKTVSENTTTVTTLSADEPVTWSLVGGEDQAKFTIDPTTGALSFVAAPNYESPTDGSTGGVNTYQVQVKATDTAGNVSLQTITVTVADITENVPAIVPTVTDVTELKGDLTPNDLLTLEDTPTVTIQAEPGVDDIALYRRDPVTGEYERVPNNGLYVIEPSNTDPSVYTLRFTAPLDHGDYAVQTWKGGGGSALSNAITIDSSPGLFDRTTLRALTLQNGEVITNGQLGGMDQNRVTVTWDAASSNWIDSDGEIIRFHFLTTNGSNVDDVQGNDGARSFTIVPSGTTITCTLTSGSTLVLNTQTGAYTYNPAPGATLDAFLIAASDGRQGSTLNLTFDARDPLDRDGITSTVESALANMKMQDGGGDLNNDGIADATQNAVTTLAWTTADKFTDSIEDATAFTAISSNLTSVITLWVALPESGDVVDESAQLFGVQVIDPSQDGSLVGGSKPDGANWDPIQFSIEPLQSMGLIDSDSSRAGLQVTIRIDVSNAGIKEGDFTRYMKYVSAYALQQYAAAGMTLTDLDGSVVSSAGWYDFTQRVPGGDGAQFVHAGGKLTTIVITLTDNNFGDNDGRVGYLKDPGVPLGPAQQQDSGSKPVSGIPPLLPTVASGPGIVQFRPSQIVEVGSGVPQRGSVAEPGDAADGELERSINDLRSRSLARDDGSPGWMTYFDRYTNQRSWHATVIPADFPSLVVFRGMPDQFSEADTEGGFNVPWDTFAHTQSDAQIALRATLATGARLPNWLLFDTRSGKFSVQPPAGYRGELVIKLTARDQDGREASTLFRFRIGDALNRAAAREATSLQGLATSGDKPVADTGGRAGLSDKFRSVAGRR